MSSVRHQYMLVYHEVATGRLRPIRDEGRDSDQLLIPDFASALKTAEIAADMHQIPIGIIPTVLPNS